jgi:hypothetical protein
MTAGGERIALIAAPLDFRGSDIEAGKIRGRQPAFQIPREMRLEPLAAGHARR